MLVDLASGRRCERIDPRLVGVPVPQDEVQLAFAGADRSRRRDLCGRGHLQRRPAWRGARAARRRRKHGGRGHTSEPDPTGMSKTHLHYISLVPSTYVWSAVQASLTLWPWELAASAAASIFWRTATRCSPRSRRTR